MPYKLSKRSKTNTLECHPDLQYIIHQALKVSFDKGLYDFGIIDGGRTLEEQKENVRTGASKTLKSRHLLAYSTNPGFYGDIPDFHTTQWSHAFDFMVYTNGKGRWEFPLYQTMWDEVWQPIGKEAGIKIEWGGNWKMKDGPHIQLKWSEYPVK